MGKGFDTGPVSDVPDYIPPVRFDPDQKPVFGGPPGGNALASHDAMDPTSGIDVDEAVSVPAPLLAGQKPTKDDRDQTYWLHSAKLRTIPISAYAIPRALLTLDAAGTQPAMPAQGQPDVAAGSVVYGPDHLPLVVFSADAANVIVQSSKTIHFAVGAGSCVLVQTNAGWYLFDAGINQTEPHALGEAIARIVITEVGHDGIRATFLTHGHYDHIAMLKFLARYVQIDAIVANPRQILRDVYQNVREAIHQADLERRKEETQKLHDDPQQRAAFEHKLRDDTSKESLNDIDMERAWTKEVETEIDTKFPVLQELVAIPIKGTNQFDTVDTRPLHGDKKQSMKVEDLLQTSDDMELRGVVPADVRSKPHAPPASHEEDRMSTTYLLRIGNRRLIMMPDLRRTDLETIAEELKAALGTRDVDFQEWQLGHHAQSGFEEGPVSAKTLLETLELLHDFRAKGTGGQPGRDVVIVSVDAAQVSPAQIRMLRLIGFKTYLAKSQNDVHAYDIMSGGKLIRGVKGPLAPESIGEATLQRSIVGRRQLEAAKQQVVDQRAAIKGKGSRAPRKELADKIEAQQKQIDNIKALEHALIDAVHADPYDDAAVAKIEKDLDTALDQAGIGKVVTSDSTLTDTALVLLREPLGDNPAEGTPEAAQRAKDVALREQKARVDLLRERTLDVAPEQRQEAYAELYVEMISYERELSKVVSENGPGVTQHVANKELQRIKAERAQLEASFQGRTEAVRLPDGHLAENRIVKISPPAESEAPHGPSKVARAMLEGLEITGRIMGGVMVISTITGTKDMIERYENGQATLAQLGIGSTREITSGIVALKMLKGEPVGNGAFVV
ncbi:MAG TPA: MBL fold metallo-hydrolase, partial [Kofleriaceae bacterium]|nr:MBL fold metallo-hydrolase [Kofleriaceae bacterium]